MPEQIMAKAHRITGIDCEGAALAGIQKALRERFYDMYKLRQDALSWKDPEGVHSMRVASRRLRSALDDFIPHLNKRRLTSSLKQIRSIADALGEVRDQDVAILALEELASHKPREFSATLHHLIGTRKEIRRTARKKLRSVLLKGRLKELSSEFKSSLTTAASERKGSLSVSNSGDGSYISIARAILRDRLDELEELSAGLYRPLEGKPLHEMRIAAKSLRYAIELFDACWSSSILPFAKNAARLQSALGKVHDCDIWIEDFGKEIVESKKLKQQEQSVTFVWLFTHFNELRNRHFQEAFSIWNEWEAEGFSDQLKEALKL
jgi:CHAD domain-containing protein